MKKQHENSNLFDLSDIKGIELPQKSKSVSNKSLKNNTVLMKRFDKCSKVIGKIQKDTSIHYVSMGEWSSHDLLKVILEQIGKADVYIATWSISEPGTIMLLNLVKSGLINSILGVFDWRIKVRNPKALQLAKYNFNKIYLTTCHAKVTVICNKDYNISIVGSANYTNNPRIESGVITESKEIADFHKDWISGITKNSKLFE